MEHRRDYEVGPWRGLMIDRVWSRCRRIHTRKRPSSPERSLRLSGYPEGSPLHKSPQVWLVKRGRDKDRRIRLPRCSISKGHDVYVVPWWRKKKIHLEQDIDDTSSTSGLESSMSPCRRPHTHPKLPSMRLKWKYKLDKVDWTQRSNITREGEWKWRHNVVISEMRFRLKYLQ